MGDIIEVVYKNGVLKPLKKVDFKDGEVLRVEIKGKVLSDSFYEKLNRIRSKTKRVDGVNKILEDVRNDSY